MKRVFIKLHFQIESRIPVMGKNWIHIQDGTKDGENFDLTITTLDKVKLDELVTFEGTISLKKDFGYGYFYELIMEDAKLVK